MVVIRPSQIYRWRRDLLGARNGMVPVMVTGHSSEAVSAPVLVIEVQDATVRVMADAAASLVTKGVSTRQAQAVLREFGIEGLSSS